MVAIVFDVDDTLYDQLIPFQLAYEKNFDFTDIPIEKLFNYSRFYSDKVFNKSENGLISLDDLHIYRIQKAFNHFDKSITEEQGRNFQCDYQMNQAKIELLPEMGKALDICSQYGVRLGIITNGPAEHQMKKIKDLKLNRWIPDDHIFISGQLGYAKPDIKLFRYVEKMMKLDTENTFFVEDSFANDIVGAKNAGWNAVWINRRNRVISDYEASPDFIIDEKCTITQFICSLVLQGKC